MGQQLNFRTVTTWDNKTQFAGDGITITIEEFSLKDGKHAIADPKTAKVYFICAGKRYAVANVNDVLTIENWYLEELLPKFQMLKFLIADLPV